MTNSNFRLISVLLLALLLSIPTNGQTLFIISHLENSSQESSPVEERQERRLAVQVIKRLKVTNDFTPLMHEFFIKDFVTRAKIYIMGLKFNDQEFAEHGIERRVLVHATFADYRRAFVVFMNAWNQFDQLHDATDGYIAATNSVEGGDILDAKFRKLHVTARDEALTPLFFSTANANPLLSLLVSSWISGVEHGDEIANNAKLKAATIRTIRGMRAFITALTKCVDLMRQAVKTLRVDRDKLLVGRAIEYKNDEDTFQIYKYWSETLEKKGFGFPTGTKLVYARIYPWEIVMTRRNGRLRGVAVYPDFDGD